eukprot:3088733-Lingulodinium_polyedra.AAC.1
MAQPYSATVGQRGMRSSSGGPANPGRDAPAPGGRAPVAGGCVPARPGPGPARWHRDERDARSVPGPAQPAERASR